MFLHEEYARRFCRQPLVGCPRLGYLILENHDSHKWFFVTIKRVNVRNNPQEYVIACFSLYHNGYKHSYRSGNRFFNFLASESLCYDEYEDFLLSWAKEIGKPKMVSKNELSDKTWEMVLYSLDGWFAQKGELTHELFKSVDRQTPKRERNKIISRLSDCLWDQHSDILIWRNDVLNNYCDWIIKLT